MPSAYILLITLETKFHSLTKIKQNYNSLCFNIYVLRYQKIIGRNMWHACGKINVLEVSWLEDPQLMSLA